MLVVQVFLFKDGNFLGTEMASGTRIEIGRDPGHDVVLPDDTVSRSHAFLFDEGGRTVIQDAGSTVGTLVNGERVTTPRVLSPRDDVTIGRFALKFKRMDQKREEPAAAEFGALPATRAVADLAGVGLDSLDDQTIVDPHMDLDRTLAGSSPGGIPTIEDGGQPPSGSSAPAPVALGGEAPFVSPMTTPISPEASKELVEQSRRTANFDTTTPGQRPPSAPLSDEPSAGTPPAPSVPNAVPTPVAHVATPTRAPPAPTPTPIAAATSAPLHDGAAAEMPAVALVAGNAYFDDDEEEDIAPAWSLVQALVRQTPPETASKKGAPVVEVIHYRGEAVVDHAVLREGETFRFGRTLKKDTYQSMGLKKPVALVKHKKDHVAELRVTDDVSGRLLREGRQVDIRGDAQKKVPMTSGDMASLDLYGDRVFVRLSKRGPLIPDPRVAAEESKYKKLWLSSFGSGALTWAVIAAAAWLVQYRSLQQTVIQLEDDGFAEVFEEREVELEIPEPEEPEEEIPIEETPPEKTETKPQDKPPEVQRDKSGGDEKAPKKVGVLDALDKLPTNKNAGAESLTKATSNIKGVRVPGASGVKVSSLMKKGVDGVSVGGASGGVSTSSLNSILKKGGGGKGPGSLAGKRNRKVRGKVRTMKRRYKKKGQGTIDKAAVLRVIQSHIGEIQYCYEKQLRKTQGLSGRVQLEWTINKSGRVSIVKNKQSTLKSPAAITCMIGRVKKWKFPKPSGGDVIISFPFVFNTI